MVLAMNSANFEILPGQNRSPPKTISFHHFSVVVVPCKNHLVLSSMPRKTQLVDDSGQGEQHRDRLLRYMASNAIADTIKAAILEQGYIVLPKVFTADEADAEYSRMWNFVTRIAPQIKRNNQSSWTATAGCRDPWPCAQRDMFQLHQAGWLFHELREKMAERVFGQLYGTEQLHTSKDGFTLQRPAQAPLDRTPNDHFDQGCRCRLLL